MKAKVGEQPRILDFVFWIVVQTVQLCKTW